ncbi:hypothetical protein [Massilia pseudoviolaceinigra]|uniref:hypothetical protein n=1 Tax=Massilia pseudoviolaceinigra TaxID=3057165 RepID=UPI002796DD92|nr:hypothetical protein [Massilia sp. CCM 9206]MDQ1921441.1 hypothetical protein [Massilia sp. CCM 9206]
MNNIFRVLIAIAPIWMTHVNATPIANKSAGDVAQVSISALKLNGPRAYQNIKCVSTAVRA